VPDDPALQKLIDTVVPLHHVVKVDYFIPGCPPSANTIRHVVGELLQDREPVLENGKVLRHG
jgi:NAD-reducing hydrogenase small subunit